VCRREDGTIVGVINVSMSGGLRLVIGHAFSKLGLHRLEAYKVLGRWRDHERWAVTVEDVRR
jgi:hypothetical protein